MNQEASETALSQRTCEQGTVGYTCELALCTSHYPSHMSADSLFAHSLVHTYELSDLLTYTGL